MVMRKFDSSIFSKFLVAVCLILTLCGAAIAAGNEAVGKAVKELMSSNNFTTGSHLVDQRIEDIRSVYAARSYKPIWSRDSGPKSKAKALLEELKASKLHGLSPDFYGVDQITPLGTSLVPEDLARMDLLLTGALYEFSRDLLNGRLTNSAKFSYNLVDPLPLDPAQLVATAATAGNLRQMLSEMVGDDRRYLRLVAKMLEFIQMDQTGLWPKSIDAKDIDSVRKALALTGDLPFDQMKKSGPVDEALSRAIADYQERQGLIRTGELDAATLEHLNAPLDTRIRRIKVNLERRRWQNRPVGQKLLYLNLVDRQLKLLVDDKTQLQLEVDDDQLLASLPTFYGTVTGADYIEQTESEKISLSFVIPARKGAKAKMGRLLLSNSNNAAITLLKSTVAEPDVEAINTFERTRTSLRLSSPLNLFVTYLTVWATADGKIQFRPDTYDRDVLVMKELGL